MEYLDGQPLSRVEERAGASDGRFPIDMRLLVLCQVLEGLDYAHHLKDYGGLPLHIVHRDISPQNVFVTYSGQTKLVDFGIAKTLESSKTRAGVVKGKVPYMAPEQVLTESVDHRTDLFSVGVMLWEAIACRPMYGTQSIYEIMRRLVQGSVINIRDVVPDVPEALEAIVNRALQHKPENRYQDASAFHHDLSTYLDSLKRVNARDVGECVAQLFAQERREIDDVIRRALTDATEPSLAPLNLQALEVIPTVRSSLAAARGSDLSNSIHTQPPSTMPVEHHDSSAVNLGTTQSPPAKTNSAKRWRTLGSLALLVLVAAAVVPGILKFNGRTPPPGPIVASPEIPSGKLPIAVASPASVSVGSEGPASELGNSGAANSDLPGSDSEATRAAIAATLSSKPTRAASRPSPAARVAAPTDKSTDFRAFPSPHANKAAAPKAERKFIEPWASQ
jgi:serine/threonine-protein kinase